MCECGCVMNDDVYTLPGPGKTMYVIRLSGECENCDAPPGVTIEQYKPGDYFHEYYSDPDNSALPLPLENWSDGLGAAIVTGMRKHEFVKVTQSYLVGIDSREFGDDGKIDDIGAETILEEMYEDSQVMPRVVT